MEGPIFFKNWTELWRTAVVALIVYSAFIVMLRGSGKRTLSKLNVFDFVFVVALGSTLASTILTPDITVTKGVVACATLLVLQVILSKVAQCVPRLEKWINGAPTLIMYRGEFLKDVMRRERITEEEIRAAVRTNGLSSAEDIQAVVLETDGTISIVWQNKEGSQSALIDLIGQENRGERKRPPSKEEERAKRRRP